MSDPVTRLRSDVQTPDRQASAEPVHRDDPVRCPNCDNLRLELGAERQSMRSYRVLRAAVDAMMAPLGYHGSISARDDRVQAVMDALAQVDALENEGNPIKWSAILESLRDKDKGGPV